MNVNETLNINLHYREAEENIVDVLMKDINIFLNDYIKEILK